MNDIQLQVTVTYTVPGDTRKKDLDKIRERCLNITDSILSEAGSYAAMRLVDLQLEEK